jgi:uncharacterized tellurite resistance protein B-like protein
MANTNSNVSALVNKGEHLGDVINYLKDASEVFGDITAIASTLKTKLEEDTDNFKLVDAIWRLAMNLENSSGWQAEEIERNGIRQEMRNG